MITDRELLELSAKAAGFQIVLGRNDSDAQVLNQNAFYLRNAKGVRSEWNPLTNDGDAFRLAVVCHIDIRHFMYEEGRISCSVDRIGYG